MLDIKEVMRDPSLIQSNADRRSIVVDVWLVVSLYKERTTILKRIELLKHRRNQISWNFISESNKSWLQKEARKINEEAGSLSEELEKLTRLYTEEALKIPNLTHPNVPDWSGENENMVIREVGERRVFNFEPLDHVELGKRLDIIDFEAWTKVAWPKFYYLKNDGALLENALVQFALWVAIKNGFKPMVTPVLAKDSVLEGAWFNPRGSEDHIFKVWNAWSESTDWIGNETSNRVLNLIGTSEITVGGYFQWKVLSEWDLPLKIAGITDCFRKEIGSGRLSKWLYRVPNFKKVELFQIVKPEDGDVVLLQILDIEESIFRELGLPYRVQNICAGDMGGPAYQKFDIEAWMPAIEKGGRYWEVTSCSNCTDFQARRWNIKYKNAQWKNKYVHTLNGTAVATTRAFLAILENFQNPDGTVTIPEVLRPYMYGKSIIDWK